MSAEKLQLYTIVWRCNVESCTARVKTTLGYELLEPSAPISHNHDKGGVPPDDKKQFEKTVRIAKEGQPDIVVFATKFANSKKSVGEFCFSRRNASVEHVTWQCDKCKAKCVTTHQLDIISSADETSHNHDWVSMIDLAKRQIFEDIKSKATEFPNERPTKLMSSVYQNMENMH